MPMQVFLHLWEACLGDVMFVRLHICGLFGSPNWGKRIIAAINEKCGVSNVNRGMNFSWSMNSKMSQKEEVLKNLRVVCDCQTFHDTQVALKKVTSLLWGVWDEFKYECHNLHVSLFTNFVGKQFFWSVKSINSYAANALRGQFTFQIKRFGHKNIK